MLGVAAYDWLEPGRYGWLPLLALPVAPALAGGINALIRNAVRSRPVTVQEFQRGAMGFYWRIVLGYVLATLPGSLVPGRWLGPAIMGLALVLAHVWFAEVIMGGAGLLGGIVRGWRSVWRSPGEYALLLLPGVAIRLAADTLFVEGIPAGVARVLGAIGSTLLAIFIRTAVFHLHDARGQM
jgi:hypothetical protein